MFKENANFGEVIKHLKEGGGNFAHRVGWNGKGMFIQLQTPTELSRMSLPYIYLHTADGNLVPWLASQTDMLTEDWILDEFTAGSN